MIVLQDLQCCHAECNVFPVPDDRVGLVVRVGAAAAAAGGQPATLPAAAGIEWTEKRIFFVFRISDPNV